MSTRWDNVIHIIVKITVACKCLHVRLYISLPQWVHLSLFAFLCQWKCLLNAEGECCKWMMKMNVSKILLPAGSTKSEDREIGICILFWRVLQAGIASVWSLPFLRSPFALMNAMQRFFSSSIWNQGHSLVCYCYLEQIPQPDLFPQTDDAFTGRAIILMLFDGSGKRERWHDILLKYQFESEGRSELPAGTICLIPTGEIMREGQGKSNCFAFVAGEVLAMGLPHLSW